MMMMMMMQSDSVCYVGRRLQSAVFTLYAARGSQFVSRSFPHTAHPSDLLTSVQQYFRLADVGMIHCSVLLERFLGLEFIVDDR